MTFITDSSRDLPYDAQFITHSLADSGRISLPPGIVRITEPILIADGSHLAGAGAHFGPIGTTIVNQGLGPAIIVDPQCRGWSIKRLRIFGRFLDVETDQVTGIQPMRMRWDDALSPHNNPPTKLLGHVGIHVKDHASNYRIEGVYITRHLDGVRVDEANFQAQLNNVITDANARHGKDIGSEAGGTSTTVKIDTCFSRWNGSWGDIYRNVRGLNLVGQASDVNRHGGTMFRNCQGTVNGCTSESNPTGMSIHGPQTHLVINAPWFDPPPQGITITWARDVPVGGVIVDGVRMR